MTSIAQVVGAQLATSHYDDAVGVQPTPAVPSRRETGSPRENLILVGAAVRAAQAAAAVAEPPLTRKAWRMLSAVEALVTSYSRLTDRYSLEQVAERAHIGGNAETRRKEASRALRQLRDAGVIVYQPGRGHRLSVIGLPAPPPVGSEPTGAAAPPSNGGREAVEPVTDHPSNGGGSAPLQRGRQRPPTRVVLREENLPLHQVVLEHAGDEVEGKGDEHQDRTDVGAAVLASVLEALPAPARSNVRAPSNAGGRRTLERHLAQLSAEGWTDAQLVDELTTGLATAAVPIAVLLDRVERRLGTGPPPDPDALAAADVARKRRDELRAAAEHGRTVAATEDGTDGGRRLLEGHYQRDPEALRAALGAFEAVPGRHDVARPLRPVENDDPRDVGTWGVGLRSARAALAGAGSDRGRP